MSEYAEYIDIRGSLRGELCPHKTWKDLCEICNRDSTIARLTARVEELEGDLNIMRLQRDAKRFTDGTNPRAADTIAALTARVEELEGLVRRFMEHREKPECTLASDGKCPGPCACGYDEWFAEDWQLLHDARAAITQEPRE